MAPCRRASLQWVVMAAGKCPREGTDPYLHLLVGRKQLSSVPIDLIINFSRHPRRRAGNIESPRRRRHQAEEIDISGAEGAALKKATSAAPKAPRRKIDFSGAEGAGPKKSTLAAPKAPRRKIAKWSPLLSPFRFWQ